MDVKDWTKLVVCVGVLVVVSLLMYWGKIAGEAGCSLIAAVLGYVFGNAHGVVETNRNLKTMQGQINTLIQEKPPDNSGI